MRIFLQIFTFQKGFIAVESRWLAHESASPELDIHKRQVRPKASALFQGICYVKTLAWVRFASEWGLSKSVHGSDVISGSRRVLLPSMKLVLFLSRYRKSFWRDCIVAVDNAISTERYI